MSGVATTAGKPLPTCLVAAILISAAAVACTDRKTTEPAPTPVTLTWRICPGTDPSRIPAWLAYQDGDGAWTPVSRVGDGFTFTLTKGRGGLTAVTTFHDGSSGVDIVFATAAEHEQRMDRCDSPAGRSVQGVVTGAAVEDLVEVIVGPSYAEVSDGPGPRPFVASGVPAGPFDLLAAAKRHEETPEAIRRFVTSAIVRRAVSLPASESAGTVDLSGPEAFTPLQRTMLVGNTAFGDRVGVQVWFATPGAAITLMDHSVLTDTTGGAVGPLPLLQVPPAHVAAGDDHRIVVSASRFNVLGASAEQRVAVIRHDDPGNATVGLGPILGPLTVTNEANGTPARLRVQYAAQPGYDSLWIFETRQDRRRFTIMVTRDYVRGTSVDIVAPDFSGVAGWNTAWSLERGLRVSWSFYASNLPVSAFTGQLPPPYMSAFRAADRGG